MIQLNHFIVEALFSLLTGGESFPLLEGPLYNFHKKLLSTSRSLQYFLHKKVPL